MEPLKDCPFISDGRSRIIAPRTWTRTLAALTFLAAVAPTLSAQAEEGEVRDVVYVESNNPKGNAILAYKRATDGTLSPLAGSPFSTGGLGVTPSFNLGPFDSDQEIITNPSKTLLFAVNGGSDTIAVFKIADTGVLTPIPGSPFPSGGSNPVSLGLAGDILCVVNQDGDPGHPGLFLPNYTSLRVGPAGRLTPIPGSTVYDENGSFPSQALVATHGDLLFGADFLGGALRSFAISPGGRLEARALLPLPPAQFADTGKPPFPLGLAVHPSRPILYVGFVTINRIGVYHYNKSGALHFLGSVPDSGSGPCWLLLNKAATRMYASNTGDPSVSVYDLSFDPTQPIEIQKINLKVVPGSNPGGYQFALDPSGNFLHVVTQQFSATSTVAANALHILRVGPNGTLTEVPSSPTLLPVPNLTRPQGVLAF